ncbi:MAG: ParB/RepB/Spo0J family partition protein [Calditrichaeota bacterium]|nr:ParB/RepB/Spo0J family partition protein [Calditrichota bacterium]
MFTDADLEVASDAKMQMLPVTSIKPNSQQPRQNFDQTALDELTASVSEKGVIQPLIVRQVETGYELIAGERRFHAAKKSGLTEVPARIMEVANEAEMLELSIIENLQRSDLNPVELALGYKNLQIKWGLTQEKVAQRVGKDRATVANTMRLLELPDPVLLSLRNGEISMGHAKAILAVPGTARRSALWKRVVSENLSVRQTEQTARSIASVTRPKPVKRQPSETSPELYDFTDRIRRSLGTKVRIVKKGKKGSIQIEFFSIAELERLVDMLSRM